MSQHLADFRRLHIPHPRFSAAAEALRLSLEAAREDRHITVLVGPTGVGKTALWERLEAEYEKRVDPSDDDAIGSLYVRLQPQRGAYRSAALDRALLIAGDEVLIDRKQVLPGRASSRLLLRGTNEGRRAALLNLVRYRRPGVIAIEEAQHLTYLTGRGMQLAIDDLKTLTDSADVPILLIGTYELLGFAPLSGQLARRTHDVEFPRYSGERGDLVSFVSTLRFIAKNLPCGFDVLDPEVQQRMYAGCIGTIGLLKQWLEKALRLALREGRDTISMSHLEAVAWPAGNLGKMLTEAQDGEGAMRRIRGDLQELYEAIGMPRPARERSRQLPGRRLPVRDRTGESAGETKSA